MTGGHPETMKRTLLAGGGFTITRTSTAALSTSTKNAGKMPALLIFEGAGAG